MHVIHRVVAFTGAGISKASGIPTFEELGDIRDKLSREYFNAHPQEFFDLLKMLRDISDKAEPNPAHLALAQYHVPIVTMNVDGLHIRAGSTDVLEIHGHLREVHCASCHTQYNFETVYDCIYCIACKTVLQPNVVLYGDMIPDYIAAMDMICSGERLLVVGTSFYTSTAHMTSMAKNYGTETVIMNEDAENQVPLYLEQIYR